MSYTYRILHIADPHFSKCHFVGLPANVGRRHAEEIEKVLLERQALDSRFDVMVLSGDFTFGCQQDGFAAAQAFIDRLSRHVRPKGVLAVPGNHDVNLGEKPIIIGNLSLPMPKDEAEEAFSKFLGTIHHHCGQPPGEPNHCLSMVTRIRRSNERGLILIGLNSSRVERRDAQGWGYVGMDQIYQIAAELSDPASDHRARNGDLLVAVIHHNPLPIWDLGLDTLARAPEKRKFSFMMDTGSVLSFLADLGVGVVLHGHTHVQSVKSVDGYGSDRDRKRDATLILGSGTFGLAVERRDARLDPVHHFQIIEIETTNGKTPALSFQDFRALIEPRDAPRQWKMQKPPSRHPLTVFWDGKRTAQVLEEKEFDSNRAKQDYHIAQSWSILRTRVLKLTDWPRALEELYLRVKGIEASVTLTSVSNAVERLFNEPPTEHDLCEWTLEQYLARVLKQSGKG